MRCMGSRRKAVLVAVGAGLLLAGALFAYLGLKPLAPLLELSTGGAQAAERNKPFLDDLERHLGDAALPVGGGVAALLAGFVVLKVGLAPPKPRPVEEQVREQVERRLALHATASPPVSPRPQVLTVAAPSVVHAPAAASAPPARRTHCGSCGSVLVAGGRLCPQGHAQG